MSCVHSRMSCNHSRTGWVHSTHARRRWHLLRNVCSAIARRFFLTCSKFDGARSACGICLAHLGDSTVYVWRTQSVNEDPRAYVAYLPRISYFFRTPCQRSSIAGQWNRGIKGAHLRTWNIHDEIDISSCTQDCLLKYLTCMSCKWVWSSFIYDIIEIYLSQKYF